jgi:hypothetical protein
MINFVSKDEKTEQMVGQIRRTVVSVTTIVLLIYVMIMAGILGWTLFWSAREKKSSNLIDSVSAQIIRFSETEAVVRKLETRAKLVDDFLNSRGDASDAARLVIDEEFPILSWDYNAGGAQTIQVSATSPAQLKLYADQMHEYYEKVQPAKVTWTQKEGWTGSFLLFGRKKT